MKIKQATVYLFYSQDGAHMYTELPSVSVKRPKRETLYLVPRLRLCGATPPYGLTQTYTSGLLFSGTRDY